MSSTTRTYNLRVRPGAGVLSQVSDPASRSLSPKPVSRIPRPVSGGRPVEGTPVHRRYSDVVTGSLPSSPTRVEEMPPTFVDPDVQGGEEIGGSKEDPQGLANPDKSSAEESVDKESKKDTSEWKTITRKYSSSNNSSTSFTTEMGKTLSKEQIEGVEAAEKFLPPEEKEKLARRAQVIKESIGKTERKGKGRDPREWGNISLSKREMDLEAQEIALDSYKANKEEGFTTHKIRNNSSESSSSSSESEPHKMPKVEKLEDKPIKTRKTSTLPPEIGRAHV